MEYGAHLPLMDFGGHPYTLDHLTDYARRRGRARLHHAGRQRPPGLRGAVARRADGARLGDRCVGLDDAGHHGGAPDRARTGGAGQGGGRARPPVRRPGGRRGRAGIVAASTTARSGSTSTSGGAVSTRRCRRCARSGDPVAEPFVGRFYSTDGSTCGPDRPGRRDRRSGSAAGAPRRGSGARPVSPTGGWPRRTTRRRRCSPTPGRPAGAPRRPGPRPRPTSPMRWRPCGSTSPTTRPRRTGSCATGWRRPCTDPRTCSASACRSGPPARSRRSSHAFREAGVQRVLVWPVADEARQLELFRERVVPLVEERSSDQP